MNICYSRADTLILALLIHGGGFMTLSKKAIRPHQIQFLLDKGILPVSVDYRLCPETNLIDGPITDVRDALFWARQELPAITSSQDYIVDPNRIIVIGWSTGGYLAMSTAWSSIEVGQTPPCAILSFYSPTDITAKGKRTVENFSVRRFGLTTSQIMVSMVGSDIPKAGERGRNRGTSFECLYPASL